MPAAGPEEEFFYDQYYSSECEGRDDDDEPCYDEEQQCPDDDDAPVDDDDRGPLDRRDPGHGTGPSGVGSESDDGGPAVDSVCVGAGDDSKGPGALDCPDEEEAATATVFTFDSNVVSEELLASLAAKAPPLHQSQPHQGDGGGGDDAQEPFLVMDIDVAMQRRVGTRVTLYGRRMDGRTVAAHVSGWHAYLYVPAPYLWERRLPGAEETIVSALQAKLETRLCLMDPATEGPSLASTLRKAGLASRLITGVSTCRGRSIVGYRVGPTGGEMDLVKIEVIAPRLIGPLRDCFAGYRYADAPVRGLHVAIGFDGIPYLEDGPCATYNSNLEPIMQLMSDLDIAGCQWVRYTPGVAAPAGQVAQETFCDVEFACRVGELEWLSLEDHGSMGPLRTLSFDIEVAADKGSFPAPDVAAWPVIQVSMCFREEGRDEQPPPILLSLGKCDPVDGARVLAFDYEMDLLRAIAEIARAYDPDFITGHNICDFDFAYLVRRAQNLDVELEFASLARSRRKRLRVQETVVSSAQKGNQKKNKVIVPGRVVLDTICWMRENFMLESYTLEAVCRKFLDGQNKEDVKFTEITPMWQSGPAGRSTLGLYCVQDARLCLDLLDKLMITCHAVERARVFRLPPDLFLKRGSLAKFNSQLLPEARRQGYVIPHFEPPPRPAAAAAARRKDKFQGATVLDVVRGLHADPTAVVDFASLYPSIIIGHNLDYSTIVLDFAQPDLPDTLEVLSRHHFVHATARKGVVPTILEKLLALRKRCKADAAREQDPAKKASFKGREQSCKVSCNSIYGAIGCPYFMLALKAIPESVTALGRAYILKVKSLAESMFTTERGFEGNARVVAGDTDSVFVTLPVPAAMKALPLDAVAEAMRMAELLVEAVNAFLPAPMRLEPEKVFINLLIMKKKRYAGLKYLCGAPLSEPPTVDIKGVECVRRDGCPLVRGLVRDVLECLVHTGDVDGAAAIVRRKVREMLEDTLPVEEYAIRKKLSKGVEHCMAPLTDAELARIRGQAVPPPKAPQLSYAELDDAIRRRVVRRDGSGVARITLAKRMPQVKVTLDLRFLDPGSAPVPGLPVDYVVTLNGKGKDVFDKAEALSTVKRENILVDREGYYFQAVRTAINAIFQPIFEGRERLRAEEEDAEGAEPSEGGTPEADTRRTACGKRSRFADEVAARVSAALGDLLWDEIKRRRFKPSVERTRQIARDSPIARAFARAAAAAATRPRG